MQNYLLLLITICTITNALPRQTNTEQSDSKELQYIVEKTINSQTPEQQQEKQGKNIAPIAALREQQTFSSPSQFGFNYLEPQFQYPGFNFLQDKQHFPRVQPQIVLYGAGGQGQPILINPGSPPGNFLIPHQPQPGPNVFIRGSPQRPVFVAGYPKPAHIPPIEKDAEEIPTNPAKIPPLPSVTARKPEKLETFNEGKDYPTKSAGEADVLAAADRNPQLIPRPNLKPGQRFFILNGEHLFTNFPLHNVPDPYNVNLKYSQLESEPQSLYQQPEIPQRQQEIEYNSVPVQTLLLRNAVTSQIQDLNQPSSQAALFRSIEPLNFASQRDIDEPIGQFRFTPPSEPYFSFDAEDVENDSVVVDARIGDEPSSTSSDANNESASSSQNSNEPSTAQAAPGAIALAGPGGVAGAAPRGTALVGKGGLAISSPQATAVAGPNKKEEDRKPTKKSK